MTQMTEKELLQAAFAAISRGDYAERDRLIALARAKNKEGIREAELRGDRQAKPIPLIKQADGSYRAATLPPLYH